MQKNGVELEELEQGDAQGSSGEVASGDHMDITLTTILVSNGDSRIQVVVSDGDQLSPKKPHLSRTPSSHDECRSYQFSHFFSFLILFLSGVSLLGPYEVQPFALPASQLTQFFIFSKRALFITKPNIPSIGIWELEFPGTKLMLSFYHFHFRVQHWSIPIIKSF